MRTTRVTVMGGVLLIFSVTAAGAEPEGLSRAIRFLGRFHPLAVHFPIALVLAAVLAEFLLMTTRRRGFAEAGHFTVTTGALGSAAAITLGLMAGAYASYSGKYADTLALHRGLGFAAGAFAMLAAVLSALSRRENASPRLAWIYRGALLAAAALVGVTGHLGATLVYGFDLLKW